MAVCHLVLTKSVGWQTVITLIRREKMKGNKDGIAACLDIFTYLFLLFIPLLPCSNKVYLKSHRWAEMERQMVLEEKEKEKWQVLMSKDGRRWQRPVHSTPFSSYFSVLTSCLWQLTWRHEYDDDILWPLPCLTHYFDTSCLDGMSAFMLTNLERSLLFLAQPLCQICLQTVQTGRQQKELFICGDCGVKR